MKSPGSMAPAATNEELYVIQRVKPCAFVMLFVAAMETSKGMWALIVGGDTSRLKLQGGSVALATDGVDNRQKNRLRVSTLFIVAPSL